MNATILLVIAALAMYGWLAAWYVQRHHGDNPIKWFLISFLLGPLGFLYTILKTNLDQIPQPTASMTMPIPIQKNKATKKADKGLEKASKKADRELRMAERKAARATTKVYCSYCGKTTKHVIQTTTCKKCGNVNKDFAQAPQPPIPVVTELVPETTQPSEPQQKLPMPVPATEAITPQEPAAPLIIPPTPVPQPIAPPVQADHPRVASGELQPTPAPVENKKEQHFPKRPKFGHIKTYCPICKKETPQDKNAVCVFCHEENNDLAAAWGLTASKESAAAPLPSLPPLATHDTAGEQQNHHAGIIVEDEPKPDVASPITPAEPVTRSSSNSDSKEPTPIPVESNPKKLKKGMFGKIMRGIKEGKQVESTPNVTEPEPISTSEAPQAVLPKPLPIVIPSSVSVSEAAPEKLAASPGLNEELGPEEEAHITAVIEDSPESLPRPIIPSEPAPKPAEVTPKPLPTPTPRISPPEPLSGISESTTIEDLEPGTTPESLIVVEAEEVTPEKAKALEETKSFTEEAEEAEDADVTTKPSTETKVEPEEVIYENVKRPHVGSRKAFCPNCEHERLFNKEGVCKKCKQVNSPLRQAWGLEEASKMELPTPVEAERIESSLDAGPPETDTAEELLALDTSKLVPAADKLPKRPKRRGTAKTYCPVCETERKFDKEGCCKKCGTYHNTMREFWGLGAMIQKEGPAPSSEAAFPTEKIEEQLRAREDIPQDILSVPAPNEQPTEPQGLGLGDKNIVEEPTILPTPEPTVEPPVPEPIIPEPMPEPVPTDTELGESYCPTCELPSWADYYGNCTACGNKLPLHLEEAN